MKASTRTLAGLAAESTLGEPASVACISSEYLILAVARLFMVRAPGGPVEDGVRVCVWREGVVTA